MVQWNCLPVIFSQLHALLCQLLDNLCQQLAIRQWHLADIAATVLQRSTSATDREASLALQHPIVLDFQMTAQALPFI